MRLFQQVDLCLFCNPQDYLNIVFGCLWHSLSINMSPAVLHNQTPRRFYSPVSYEDEDDNLFSKAPKSKYEIHEAVNCAREFTMLTRGFILVCPFHVDPMRFQRAWTSKTAISLRLHPVSWDKGIVIFWRNGTFQWDAGLYGRQKCASTEHVICMSW